MPYRDADGMVIGNRLINAEKIQRCHAGSMAQQRSVIE